jgi:hypothetical protein
MTKVRTILPLVAVVAALILARIHGPDAGPGPGGSGDPGDPGGNLPEPGLRCAGHDRAGQRQGFAAGESVTVRFHTEVVGHTETDGQGTFDSVSVEVPEDWRFTGQFSFLASGESSLRSAQREFRVT